MNDARKIELLRKQNDQLNQQLDFYKENLGKIQINPEDEKLAKDLIQELETIRDDWIVCLKRLQEVEDKYNELIATTMETINELKQLKKKLSFMERLKYKIKHKFNNNKK